MITSRYTHHLIGALLLTAGLATARANTESLRPDEVLKKIAFEQKLDEAIPLDLTFRDEQGAAVPLSSFFGTKPVILTLVYYECPMLCTLTLNGLVKALKILKFDVGEDFEIVTVSIDPGERPYLARDKKKAYLETYGRPGAERGWHFLTGDEPEIQRLADAVGFHYVYDERSGEYAHPAGAVILTPEGRMSRYFLDVDFAPKDLRFALMDAANARIGSLVDQILLYCYHYDPETGTYGVAIMRTVRLAGSATVVVLAGSVFAMTRRKRKELDSK